MSESRLLVDTLTFKTTLLEDNRSKGGKLIARGEFARADLATENKRVYPKTLWERELGRLARQIAERKVYGELDHPMDGRTQLKRVSHILTGLRLEGKTVIGEAEILDTPEGKTLRAILEASGAVGVSSRGFGTTRPNLQGEDIVQDDYRLMTFDFVAEPANTTSYPSIHAESTTNSRAEAVMSEEKTLEQLRTSNPKLYENFMADAEREFDRKGAEIWAKKIMAAKQEAATDLRAQFAEKLEQTILDVKKTVAEAERAKLLSDPTVAGAKTTLEGLKEMLRPYIIPADVNGLVTEKEAMIGHLQKKLAEQELVNTKLAEENDRLASIAKEAGYRFHMEKLLNGHQQSDLIRKLVGDVKQYESIEEINGKVAIVVEQIEKTAKRHSERDHEVSRLREENERLRMASEKALEATKQLAIEKYAESRLANHPQAGNLRQLIEAKQPSSKEEVDTLLSSVRDPLNSHEALEEARARVRRMVGSGTRESILEHEEKGNTQNNGVTNGGDFNGLGIDINSLRTLSGIEN